MKILPSLLLLAAAVPAGAQSQVYNIADVTPKYDERFGEAVAGVGDVNGDGLPDFAVGAPYGSYPQYGPGSVSVFSGITGLRLFTVMGTEDRAAYGASVAGVGDLNGDGRGDIVVGSPEFDGAGSNGGRVQVLSGLDGAILQTLDAPLAEGWFGERVAGGGDVDRDGVPDFMATQRQGDQGTVLVISGADWALLHRFTGNAGDRLQDVADAGYVNADGHADVLVGGAGVARLMDGATGAVIYEWTSTSSGFGRRVAGGGDLDGDGVPDLLVADRFGGTNNQGFVRAYSGATGAQIRQWDGPAGYGLGLSVCFAGGDVDGDGVPDVIAGSHGDRIWVLSGGAASFTTPPGLTGEGEAVAALGDVTGDGRPEYVVGGPETYVGASDAGRVACITFSDPGPGTPVCSADGSLADCPCTVAVPVFQEAFEDGAVPAGWNADGAWHVTTESCNASCGGGTVTMTGGFMYHGNDATCDFSNSTGYGSLKSPLLTLPDWPGGNLELQFKQILGQDAEVHRAYVRVLDEADNVLETKNFSSSACGNPTRYDLNPYQGQSVRIEWLFTNDGFGTWYLGWQVDDVAVVWAPNNTQPGQGCRNSTGGGGVLLVNGSTSAAADDLVLTAAQVPPGNNAIFFVGDTFFDPPFAIGNGLSCTGGNNFRYPSVNTGGGAVSLTQPVAAALGTIQVGGTHYFQFWYRETDPGDVCQGGSNLTHAYAVTFGP